MLRFFPLILLIFCSSCSFQNVVVWTIGDIIGGVLFAVLLIVFLIGRMWNDVNR